MEAFKSPLTSHCSPVQSCIWQTIMGDIEGQNARVTDEPRQKYDGWRIGTAGIE
jgi:hypothetical protein